MRRRPIALVLVLCYLPACTTWQVVHGISPAQLIATQQPDTIRVTRTDGRRFVLAEPSLVAGDSVAVLYRGVRARIALSDIALVEIPTLNQVSTGVVLVGIAVVVAVLALIALASGIQAPVAW